MKDFPYSKPLTGALILPEESIIKDLAAWWPMTEGVGSRVNDISGHGNHGTLRGDASWVGGKFGHALTLDANGDSVAIGDRVSLRITQRITLMAWIKNDGTGADDFIVGRDNGGGNRFYALQLDGNNSDVLFLRTWTGGVEESVIGTTILSDNEWHHVVGTYDGATGRVYVDGNFEAASSGGGGLIDDDASVDITIGEAASGIADFGGGIDNVSIWDRVLQPIEIKQSKAIPFKGITS